MSEIDFTVEEVVRDGEEMVRLQTIDTSGDIGRVINSEVFTRNLEAYISSPVNDESGQSEEITRGDIVRDVEAEEYDYKNRILKVVNRSNFTAGSYLVSNNVTVAEDNDCPESDTVIECEKESDGKMFAYPESRLELIEKSEY
jgi:hypothetical protein